MMSQYMTVLALMFISLSVSSEAVITTASPDAAGECHFRVNSEHASATIRGLSRGNYPLYSCTPCVRADFEVHILSMYRAWDSDRRFRLPPYEVKVPVAIKADTPTDIKLMLMSYEVAHWVITKSANVTIREVDVYSMYINDTTVQIEGSAVLPNISTYRQYVSFDSEWELTNLVTDKFGFLSSFTGVRETYSWQLTVGECTSEPVNLTALMQITTMGPTTMLFTENPRRHKYIGSLTLATSISIIIVSIAVTSIIIMVCVCKCRNKPTPISPSRRSAPL